MTTSSTRLRLSAALAVTTLGLFSLGGAAFAGERSQGDEHRNANANAGGAAAARGATPTEDDDPATADEPGDPQPNNVADEGDNMHPSGRDRSVEHGGSGSQGKSPSDPDGDTNGGVDKPGGAGGDDLNDQDGNNGCGNDDDFEDDNKGNCGGRDREREIPPAVAGEKKVRCPEGQTMPTGGTTQDDCVKDGTCPAGTGGTGGDMTEGCDDEVGDGEDEDGAIGGSGTTGNTSDTASVLGTDLERTGVETRVLGVTIQRPAQGAAALAAADTAESATGGGGASVLGATFTRGAALARTGFGLTAIALLALSLLAVGFGLKRAGRRTV